MRYLILVLFTIWSFFVRGQTYPPLGEDEMVDEYTGPIFPQVGPASLEFDTVTALVYLEVSNDFISRMGEYHGRAYVDSLKAYASTFYAKEGINLQWTTKFWEEPEPYNRSESLSVWNRSFRDAWREDLAAGGGIPAECALFLALGEGGNGGGRAFTGHYGSSTNAFGIVMVQDSQDLIPYPETSYNAYVFLHELGHLLGSKHTHWCGWPGGALDRCYTPHGDCEPGPIPCEGGTLMSYCISTIIGLDMSIGLHPVTRAAMHNSVSNPKSDTPIGPTPVVPEVDVLTFSHTVDELFNLVGGEPTPSPYIGIVDLVTEGYWELVDTNGVVIRSGDRREVDILGIPFGRYYIIRGVELISVDIIPKK